jgi:ABC-2 type transport system permease protein
MFRGVWKLTWLEAKIFAREPLGFIGAVVAPVLVFVLVGRLTGREAAETSTGAANFLRVDLPVLAAILIALNAVLSLVTILAIYREGGILKRLRATPLRPQAILLAHVLVKLLLTALTLAAMLLAGARYYPVDLDGHVGGFALALLVTTVSLLSVGFVLASLVPTARFAQPIGSLVLYPMLALSGLFAPIESLPAALQPVARVVPLTYAVSLLRGVWQGASWSAHLWDIAALGLIFAAFTAISARVFRWE